MSEHTHNLEGNPSAIGFSQKQAPKFFGADSVVNIEIQFPLPFIRLWKARHQARSLAPELSSDTSGSSYPSNPLPDQYAMAGWLVRPPRVGEVVRLLRVARDGVMWPGVFTSTIVVDVPRAGEFATKNSIYRWQEIGHLPFQ